MLLSILTFTFGLFNLLISIDILNPNARYAFSITAMALSAIPIFLQSAIFLGELMRCKEWWLKLIVNRFFTSLLGDYGRDLILSISVYSSLEESDFDKFIRRGRFWGVFAWLLFRISRVLKWVVFCDPFSGLFQVRYKTTVIWVSERRVKRENYDNYFRKAHEDLSADFFEETMTVRGALVTFRKFNLSRFEDDNDYAIDMTFYSSQSSSVAGLFHNKQGPFGFDQNDLESACKMLVVLRILKHDSFFVDGFGGGVEPVLHCTSLKEMVDLVMFDSGGFVNYEMVTGASFGGVKADFPVSGFNKPEGRRLTIPWAAFLQLIHMKSSEADSAKLIRLPHLLVKRVPREKSPGLDGLTMEAIGQLATDKFHMSGAGSTLLA